VPYHPAVGISLPKDQQPSSQIFLEHGVTNPNIFKIPQSTLFIHQTTFKEGVYKTPWSYPSIELSFNTYVNCKNPKVVIVYSRGELIKITPYNPNPNSDVLYAKDL
jgi:hypothetical protein